MGNRPETGRLAPSSMRARDRIGSEFLTGPGGSQLKPPRTGFVGTHDPVPTQHSPPESRLHDRFIPRGLLS
jgi:hypothetical protein